MLQDVISLNNVEVKVCLREVDEEEEREGSKWSCNKVHRTKCRSFKCVKVTRVISKTNINTTNRERREQEWGDVNEKF